LLLVTGAGLGLGLGFGFLLTGHVDQGVHVFEDAVLNFLGDLAGVVIEGEALVRAAHALADEVDVIFHLVGIHGGIALEQLLGEFLLVNVFGAGFFGELVFGIG